MSNHFINRCLMGVIRMDVTTAPKKSNDYFFCCAFCPLIPKVPTVSVLSTKSSRLKALTAGAYAGASNERTQVLSRNKGNNYVIVSIDIGTDPSRCYITFLRTPNKSRR